MSSLNKVQLIGRLGQEPELKYTQSNTPVCNFSLATSEKYKDSNGEQVERTEWHKIQSWGKLAEICGKYLHKGSLVYIEGQIQTRSWEDKEGKKNYVTEIKALQMQMLDTKGESKPVNNNYVNNTNTQSNEIPSGFDDMEDSLPF